MQAKNAKHQIQRKQKGFHATKNLEWISIIMTNLHEFVILLKKRLFDSIFIGGLYEVAWFLKPFKSSPRLYIMSFPIIKVAMSLHFDNNFAWNNHSRQTKFIQKILIKSFIFLEVSWFIQCGLRSMIVKNCHKNSLSIKNRHGLLKWKVSRYCSTFEGKIHRSILIFKSSWNILNWDERDQTQLNQNSNDCLTKLAWHDDSANDNSSNADWATFLASLLIERLY